MRSIFSSESVGKGHPDKVCDQIADAIVDACLSQDEYARCAVECMITKGALFIAGEVSFEGHVDYEAIARSVLKDVGYSNNEINFDPEEGKVVVLIKEQSPDIFQGVFKDGEVKAGDQGIMFGFATNETPELMPISYVLANEILKKAEDLRSKGKFPYAKSDMKSEVSYSYSEKKIKTILVSIQHDEDYNDFVFKEFVKDEIIAPIVRARGYNEDYELIVNPSGRFVIGGPAGDTGVTGRKIVVDSYGGAARVGGGAFSGKDPSKVDRSAAYGARYICVNLVAAGLCDRCELQLTYGIGMAKPIAVHLNTYKTEHIDKKIIMDIINNVFDSSVEGFISKLNLRKPVYYKTACYGHFGRKEFSWEKKDKVKEITSYLEEKGLVLEN